MAQIGQLLEEMEQESPVMMVVFWTLFGGFFGVFLGSLIATVVGSVPTAVAGVLAGASGGLFYVVKVLLEENAKLRKKTTDLYDIIHRSNIGWGEGM